jgi:hypothetical protein
MKAKLLEQVKVKVCKSCNKELTLDNFWRQPNNKDDLFGKCKTCAMKLVNDNTLKKQFLINDNIWICNSCNEPFELTHENFNLDCTTSTGFKNRCRKCLKKSRLRFTRMIDSDSLEHYLKEIINGAKGRSRNKKIEFNLSLPIVKDLYNKQKGLCAITGMQMTHTILKGRINTNISIDRINPSKGYIIDNIQLVCIVINIMKSTLTIDELKNYCNLILKYNE